MMICVRAGLLGVTLICGSAATDFVTASPARAEVQNEVTLRPADLSARHRSQPHMPHVHRTYPAPHYFDRPIYYVPAPFVPFNFGYPLLPPPWW
jgi:hypothetical protein